MFVKHLVWSLKRPDDAIDATRWLFSGLAAVSLVIALPGALAASSIFPRLVAVTAAVVLTAGILAGYHRRLPSTVLDVAEASALMAFALGSTDPNIVLGVLFAMLWLRSLDGTTRRAVLRCGLYAGGFVAGVVLWQHVPGRSGSPDLASLGVIPTMFVTVIVGRHLAGILHAREQAARRDHAHAALGPQLLAVDGAAEVREVAWVAVEAICQATPGMMLLEVYLRDGGLHVGRTSDGFTTVPTTLSLEDLPHVKEPEETRGMSAFSSAELDAAAGTSCSWVSIALPGVPNQRADAWFLLGFASEVSLEAVASVSSVADQVALALRNSEVHRQLTVLATLDNLTGLANRASFNAALLSALSHPSRPGQHTSVLFVDLDDFKNVNDLLGHSAGDELLTEMAGRLTRAVRAGDQCARLGGDEFAVLLPGTSTSAAIDVADRIVHALGAPCRLRDGTARVSASVGLATAAAGMSTRQQLVHCADVAMYAAKANGKGRVQVFEPGLLQRDPSVQSLEQQLTVAAGRGEFVVHYQPVVSLADGRCTAVEALVRWQHPERGLLSPDAFIPAAERTGAILDIGRFVLDQACLDLAAWERTHPSLALVLHVNISGIQLEDPAFVDEVAQALRNAHLTPDRLVLEITESVVVSSAPAIAKLEELVATGITLAIDDFGTGYSALTTLRSLPVQIVKIDKSFVAGSTLTTEDRAVTEAIVQMANRMGLQTVAEGVERLDQETLLKDIGADGVQGYLYQRPCHAEQFGAWLDGHTPEQTSTNDTGSLTVVTLAPRSTA